MIIILRNPLITTLVTISLFLLITSHALQAAEASSLSEEINALKIEQARSVDEIKSALFILQSCIVEAQEKNRFTFDLQKLILAKSGDIIGKSAEFEQQADLSQHSKRDEMRAVFFQNRDILKGILSLNQTKTEYLQEHTLDRVKDTAAFFASSEWQEPQYLISLSSYWLSWNGYYTSHLYPAQDTFRKNVLEEAVSGFGRALIDFKDESIVVRSLLGRALCYKELQKYDKAIQDLNSVIAKVRRDDPLYLRSRYEKITISYLTANYESALNQFHEVSANVHEENVSPLLREGFKKLQIKIILARLEKQTAKQGDGSQQYYHEAWKELNNLAGHDHSQDEELYRFATDHAPALMNLPDAELGAMGNLAVADWHFNQKQYDTAVMLYKRLSALSDPFIEKHRDGVYFRLGYCLCQKEGWQDALSCFESFFEKFPQSSFADKTACLFYVAAAHAYRENPAESMYARYIEAIKIFLKYCPDSRDKSEAHFQLGKYYQSVKKVKESLKEFSLVEKDSPNYVQAKYYAAASNVDTLEALDQKGLRQSEEARKIYEETCRQLSDLESQMSRGGAEPDQNQLDAYLTILQAKLYVYGPERTWKKALQVLDGFERHFPLIKDSEPLCLTAKGLRMECYQQLQMFKEAEEEITSFFKGGNTNPGLWTFLYESAHRFSDKATQLRNKNREMASSSARIALLLYKKLSSVAFHDTSYQKFYDVIQFRMAELYLSENQTAEAKRIYEERLKSDPLCPEALYNLGLMYEKEDQWEEAFDIWKRYTQGLRTGSHDWFESRYRTARALSQLGKWNEACEVVTMTQILHPGLGEEPFKERFLQLQKEVCRKK